MSAWQKPDGSCVTRIAFPGSFRWPKCTGFLVLRRFESSVCIDAEKTACGQCGTRSRSFYDRRPWVARDLSCGLLEICLEFEIRRAACAKCGGVKRERLDWLADNPFYTKRFAFYIGRRCRDSTIKAIAEELDLDGKTVNDLVKQYVREKLRRVGRPTPLVIGIDEVSIRKGHTCRIVVSDFLRRRPIWFGGQDRSETSLEQFYTWLGPKKCGAIRLAVMGMWKPFRTATARRAPNAAVLFAKFHIMRHTGEALDQVRKSEYARLTGSKCAGR